MHVILKDGKVVGGPYESRAEALAQAFEKGAMPVNKGAFLAPMEPYCLPEPIYKEIEMFQGWEIRPLDPD